MLILATITLLGAITGPTPVALVEKAKKRHALLVGEQLDGDELVEVGYGYARFRREGYVTTANLEAPPTIAAGIATKGDQVTLTKRAHDEIKGSGLLGIIMDATADPVAEGFHVWNFESGSVYDLIGLHNHDIVTEIDGTPLSTPFAALGALRRASEKKVFTFKVLRNRFERTITVKVE